MMSIYPMPIFFLLPLLAIAITYFAWLKLDWASMVYQYINIARYIDESGQQISNVIGEHELIYMSDMDYL